MPCNYRTKPPRHTHTHDTSLVAHDGHNRTAARSGLPAPADPPTSGHRGHVTRAPTAVASPRASSTGRERPSGGARPTPRSRRAGPVSSTPPARSRRAASTPAQMSGGDGSPAHGAAAPEGSSSGSLAVAMAAVSVADQQVARLEDAVTYWDRGASSRRPPTVRGP